MGPLLRKLGNLLLPQLPNLVHLLLHMDIVVVFIPTDLDQVVTLAISQFAAIDIDRRGAVGTVILIIRVRLGILLLLLDIVLLIFLLDGGI